MVMFVTIRDNVENVEFERTDVVADFGYNSWFVGARIYDGILEITHPDGSLEIEFNPTYIKNAETIIEGPLVRGEPHVSLRVNKHSSGRPIGPTRKNKKAHTIKSFGHSQRVDDYLKKQLDLHQKKRGCSRERLAMECVFRELRVAVLLDRGYAGKLFSGFISICVRFLLKHGNELDRKRVTKICSSF